MIEVEVERTGTLLWVLKIGKKEQFLGAWYFIAKARLRFFEIISKRASLEGLSSFQCASIFPWSRVKKWIQAISHQHLNFHIPISHSFWPLNACTYTLWVAGIFSISVKKNLNFKIQALAVKSLISFLNIWVEKKSSFWILTSLCFYWLQIFYIISPLCIVYLDYRILTPLSFYR